VCEEVEWILLAQDRDQWRFFLTWVDFGFHKDWGIFCVEGVEFLRRLYSVE